MGTWKRTGPVVVEVDGTTEALNAVRYAGQEALRAGAELVLVAPYHSHSAHGGSMAGHDPQAPAVAAEEALRTAALSVRQCCGADLKVSTTSRKGSRLRVLERTAEGARLLVVAQRPENTAGFASVQGNLALAGRVGCPLIAVPAQWRQVPGENSVVVGIDGTALSLEAVEFAFRTAADRTADLTVVHSHQTPYERLALGDESAALTVAETLAGWDEEYPHVQVCRLLTTRPVVAALALESRRAGLIVVGAHAGPLPIGDPVTRQIIAEMTCPVAVAAHHPTPSVRS